MADVVVARSSAVEQDLDATRTRLGGHLDQLRERMTPGQVLDDVVRYFRGREGADFGRNLLSNVKDNPLPAAVTGVGLVWLMATNGRTAVTQSNSIIKSELVSRDRAHEAFLSRRDEIDDARARVRMAEQSVARRNEESEDAYLMRREDARGYAIGIARQPQDTHESFRGRIQSFLTDSKDSLVDGLQDARNRLGDAASSSAGALSGYGSTAQGAVSDAASSVGGAMSAGGQAVTRAGSRWAAALMDSPSLMGTLSLAAGALLGVLLPQSETEETALAGVAGKVRETAAGLAHDAMDKGSEAAKSVIDAGTTSVHGHGLAGEKSVGTLVDAAISGDLASDAKQVVGDLLQAGDDAIRKNLPDTQGQSPSKPA
jgi:Protein of unknown function (DUF3618)